MKFRPTLIGLAGGFASGLLGVGGGIVLVPLLARFLGLDQKRAQATSLAILVFTATAAAVAYRMAGSVDLRMAALLALGGMIGARVGALGSTRISSPTLRRWFGLLELAVGLRMLLPAAAAGAVGWAVPGGVAGMGIEVAVGFVVGALSGLLGVGGGVILVPILTLLFGMPQHEAQGVSLFMIVPTAVVGAWTQYRLGAVEMPLVAPIALASVAAAILAVMVAHLLPGPVLRAVFGLLLLFVGAQLLLRPAPR